MIVPSRPICGIPAWIEDVSQDANFPRASAARAAGVRSAIGFPILVGDETVAVMSPAEGKRRRDLVEVVGPERKHVGKRDRIIEIDEAIENLNLALA